MITDKKSPYRLVTVEELAKLREREDKLFNERTPKSREAFDKAHENLLDGVPMPWMADWGTDHPVFLEKAKDQKCWDIDGNEYIDFCLGDTGAMFGHSPDATAKTVVPDMPTPVSEAAPRVEAPPEPTPVAASTVRRLSMRASPWAAPRAAASSPRPRSP